MSEKKKKDDLIIHIVTPFIVLFLCVGIFIAAMIKPSDKLKVYLKSGLGLLLLEVSFSIS